VARTKKRKLRHRPRVLCRPNFSLSNSTLWPCLCPTVRYSQTATRSALSFKSPAPLKNCRALLGLKISKTRKMSQISKKSLIKKKSRLIVLLHRLSRRVQQRSGSRVQASGWVQVETKKLRLCLRRSMYSIPFTSSSRDYIGWKMMLRAAKTTPKITVRSLLWRPDSSTLTSSGS